MISFDDFCNKNGVTGTAKEAFLEHCADELELDEDEEEIPNQEETWFAEALLEFEDEEEDEDA